jgi:hypothetical protein
MIKINLDADDLQKLIEYNILTREEVRTMLDFATNENK